MAKIKQSKLAQADLVDVWFYIAQDNQEAAEAMIDTFEGKFQILAQAPRIGRLRDESAATFKGAP